MTKEELRQYYRKFKEYNPAIQDWLLELNEKQKQLITDFNIEKITIKEYDLPFKKLEFINNITSFVCKGRLGRRYDLLIYHDDIALAYIQYASPILNSRVSEYIKKRYGKLDFKLINDRVVELSVCVPFGILTKLLTGKLAVFVAMSRDTIEMYNSKYNTHIEVLFTTSIYGKSSMYNRVRNLQYLGLTEGMHAILTKEQIAEIKQKYAKAFPHRKIKKTAQGQHLIRLYDHLLNAGIELSFEIPKHPRGVYLCDTFLPLEENLQYWYNRWFKPRRERLGLSIQKEK